MRGDVTAHWKVMFEGINTKLRWDALFFLFDAILLFTNEDEYVKPWIAGDAKILWWIHWNHREIGRGLVSTNTLCPLLCP